MARYEVLNNQTGKTVVFDWSGNAPPSDTDMEEIFSQATKFKPTESTGPTADELASMVSHPTVTVPEPTPKPTVAPTPPTEQQKAERENRLWTTMEQYGITRKMAEELESPTTLGGGLARFTAQPLEATKLATGAWPLPVGEAISSVKNLIQKLGPGFRAQKLVPKTPGDLAQVVKDLATSEEKIKSTILLPKPGLRLAEEVPPKSEILEAVKPERGIPRYKFLEEGETWASKYEAKMGPLFDESVWPGAKAKYTGYPDVEEPFRGATPIIGAKTTPLEEAFAKPTFKRTADDLIALKEARGTLELPGAPRPTGEPLVIPKGGPTPRMGVAAIGVSPETIRGVQSEVENILSGAKIPILKSEIVGSHAKGTVRPGSDLDIRIEVPAELWNQADDLVGSMRWQDKIKKKYGIFPDIHVKKGPLGEGGAAEVGYHYAPKPLTELHGARVPGETQWYSKEIRDLMEAGIAHPEHPYIPMLNVYGPEAIPEVIVAHGGKIRHKVQYELRDLYDLNKDPRGFFSMAKKIVRESETPGDLPWRTNIIAGLAQDAGFKGLTVRNTRYLFGTVPGEVGSIKAGLLPQMASTAIGAAAGGAVAPEGERWKGALIGGGLGLAGGAVAAKLLKGAPKITPKLSTFAEQRVGQIYKAAGAEPINLEAGKDLNRFTQTVDEIKIAAPTLEKAIMADPLLKNPVVREAGETITQDILLRDMGKNPEKMVSRQMYDHLINNPETFNSVAQAQGLSVEELGAQMISHASEHGKGLQVWSEFSKKLQMINPEAADAIARSIPPVTTLGRILGIPRRIIDTWRGLLTTQLITSVRNAITQGARVSTDIIEIPLRKVLGEPDLKYGQGLEQFMNLFRFKPMYKKMEQLLDAFPGARKQFFSTYSSDITTRWFMDKMNFLNKGQEFHFRRAVMYSTLDRKAVARGQDLETILKSGEAGKIPIKDIDEAGHNALEYTWADPKLGAAVVRAVNAIPGGLGNLVVTFPRFMMNQLNYLYEFSPLGWAKFALSPKELGAVVGGNAKVHARALMGTAILTSAYAFRNGLLGDHAGPKYYQYKKDDGSLTDMRPFNPIITYLWAGDIIDKSIKGTLRMEDIAEGWPALTGMRGITLLFGVERMQNFAKDFMEAKPGSEQYIAAKNYFKGLAGTFASGFATPATTLRDFYNGFGEFVTKNSYIDPLFGPTKSRIPGIEAGLPPAYSGTREGPRKIIAPALRQLTGLTNLLAPTAYENEITRIGFNRREYLQTTGIAEFDNLIAKNTGELADEHINPFVQSEEYKSMTGGEREAFLAKYMRIIKRSGFKMAAAEDPDLYERTLGKVSQHQKKFMEELMAAGEEPAPEEETEE